MAKKSRKNLHNPKTIGIGVLILFIFVGELLFYTWSRVQCIQTGYEISSGKNRQQQLLTLQNNLKIELARLKSPQRIAKIARERLGLVMPSARQTINIE
ncbi:septum formation initiator family protein [Thermodesulfobacteriota bacterium]